jgi:hypothetical protein
LCLNILVATTNLPPPPPPTIRRTQGDDEKALSLSALPDGGKKNLF